MPWPIEVLAVDACEALGDDGPDAQLEGGERRLLARGSLSVVVSTEDKTTAPLECPVAELGVLPVEHLLRALGYVRPEAYHDAVRGHVAGRDVIPDHDQDVLLQGPEEWLAIGRRDDVMTTDDLDTLCFLGGGGASIWRSSMIGLKDAGATSGGSPSSRGSGISPFNAVAAAAAGEQR